MNILLIHSYVATNHPSPLLTEPLGLIALATYLESFYGDTISVEILDLFALGFGKVYKKKDKYIMGIHDRESIASLLQENPPDLIGITCNFTAYSEDSFELSKTIKSIYPSIPVVIGGAHVTMYPVETLENNPDVDIVVCGEGEITFQKLVDELLNKNTKSLGKIEGLCYRRPDGTIHFTGKRDLIHDINELPTPDRKFINNDVYKKVNKGALPFTKKVPAGSIMTSRGCPFSCIFCSTKVMWERKWRPLSAEKVIKEIETMVLVYGFHEIVIQDDQFVLDKNRVHQICDFLITKKLNISLSIPPGTCVWILNENLLAKMKKAGFYRLNFPIETGNENTLKFIRKPVNLEKTRETIQIANRLGFWTQGNFIIGFPYETREEMMETINYAYECGLDYANFLIATPLAGSEMTEIFIKEGLIESGINTSDVFHADHDTTTMTGNELNEIHAQAVRGFVSNKIFFYLNPINFYKHMLPKLLTLDGIVYAMKVLKVTFTDIVIQRLKGNVSQVIPVKSDH